MMSTLKSSIEKLLVQYEMKETFQLASCLSPRFKLQWCKEEEMEKMKQLLVKKVTTLAPQTEETTLQPPAKKLKLFRFMNKAQELPPSTALNQVENSCQRGAWMRAMTHFFIGVSMQQNIQNLQSSATNT